MAARNWCFTLNNPTEPLDLGAMPDLKYGLYQEEMGAEGTPHFQGTLHFGKVKRFSAIKKLLPTAHIEKCVALFASLEYCEKSDTRIDGPWEYGTRPQPGKRNDLEEIKRKIDDLVPESQIAHEHFGSYIRYHKGFKQYKRIRNIEPKREWKTQVHIIYGPPGTGKSYFAHHGIAEGDSTPYDKDSSKWWDGYTDQETVIIDDFDPKSLDWKTFLSVMDEYPLRVETKGDMTPYLAKHLIITTNNRPENWFIYNSERDLKALTRRVTKWYTFTAFKTFTVFENYEDFNKV